MELENKVRRYYQLKQKQKEIEGELADLRNDITAHCAEQEVSDWEIGNYRVRILQQKINKKSCPVFFGASSFYCLWLEVFNLHVY